MMNKWLLAPLVLALIPACSSGGEDEVVEIKQGIDITGVWGRARVAALAAKDARDVWNVSAQLGWTFNGWVSGPPPVSPLWWSGRSRPSYDQSYLDTIKTSFGPTCNGLPIGGDGGGYTWPDHSKICINWGAFNYCGAPDGVLVDQQGYTECVAACAHEYGHILGLVHPPGPPPHDVQLMDHIPTPEVYTAPIQLWYPDWLQFDALYPISP